MKRILVFSLTVLTFSNAFAQKESSHSSEIKKVTVFFQGAQVEHSKSIELKSGKQEIVFQRLTDFLDPNSVQVKAKGELTILSVRTRKNYEDLKVFFLVKKFETQKITNDKIFMSSIKEKNMCSSSLSVA